MDAKVKVVELIRCMIGIMSDYLIQQTTQIEIDRAPFSSLLTQILGLINSRSLPQLAAIKIMHRCNYCIFGFAEV